MPAITRKIYYLLQKEAASEYRKKYVLTSSILYIFMLVLILYTGIKTPDFPTWIALFWISQIFIILNCIQRNFHKETKAHLSFFYFLVTPTIYISAKIIYNILFCSLLMSINMLGFYLFFPPPEIPFHLFFLASLAGTIGITTLFTFLGNLSQHTENAGTTLSILSLPLFIPQITILLKIGEVLHHSFSYSAYLNLLLLLIALDLLSIFTALLLFKYLWKM